MKKSMIARTVAARTALVALLAAPVLLLAACGGGGGGTGDTTAGGGAGGGGSQTATAVVITQGNSQALAAEAMAATDSSVSNATSGAGFATGVQVAAGSTGANPLLLAKAARALAGKTAGAGTALATGVTTTETMACTSGSLTITVTTSGTGNAVVAGDAFSMTANNCSEGGMVMNGIMSITFLAPTNYDPVSTVYPKTLSMRIDASNFSVSEGGETESFSGDMTITMTETSAMSATVSVSSTSLTSDVGTHSVTLSNYSASVEDLGAGSSRVQISATVQTTNSRIASGTVTYTITTVTPVVIDSMGVITSGTLKVTGNGSALQLTANGGGSFTLQVDGNGDGAYESSSTVTLAELEAQL